MSRYKQPYSLYKRGKYWYYQTYTADGVRTTAKTTGQTTKTGAKTYCDNLYQTGDIAYKKTLFKNYTAHFFDDDAPFVKDRAKPLTKGSLKEYRSILKLTLLPYFSNMDLQDINYTVIKNFRVELLKRLKPNTVSGKMNVLKIIMETAYRDRIVKNNPFEFIEGFNKETNNRDAFTLEELKDICNNLKNEPDFLNLVLLAALTGLRISEAVGITCKEIIKEPDITYLNVYQQWEGRQKGYYVPCKYDSKRQIPIIPEMEKMVDFPIHRLTVLYKTFQPLKEKFETPERALSFHSLRHFFSTNSRVYGISDLKIEYILGHKIKGVKGIYTNFKAKDVKEITQYQRWLLDQLLNKEC